ncbi:hypothetical protein GmHk_U059975 [Glycine max]|nr:hypothetical protein GmHk_U059975 [Glycine max]
MVSIWDLARVEVSMEPIASLAQYYDQPLRCFIFGDFQLSPMVEEFEEILGCPLGGRKPYLFSGFYPSLARISKKIQISAQELDRQRQVENGVVGIPRKYLEVKARILADKGEWTPFIDILTLLIFEGVLFPNVDGLVDLAAIDVFLAYHNHKESPVVAMLADLYDTFDRRCEESNARIVCCTPALYVGLVSHLFLQEGRPVYPLQGYRSKDRELRGSSNGIIGGYHKWLRVRTQGLDWLPNLKTVRDDEVKASEESDEVQALKAELERARVVEEKFKSIAIKSQKRDELKAYLRSKRNLSQQLSKTEGNMWAVIDECKEKLNLAATHEQRLEDEYAKISAESEARERVIDSWHQEATMWTDRFALTLNRSQELPRLLAKAKAMADTYSAPKKIHGLLSYCQHMIDLMDHMIRNR